MTPAQEHFHGAAGIRYRFLPDWAATLGFAYDSSPVSDEDRTVDFPVGEGFRIGVGTQWKVSEAIELGAACEFLWMGDLPVDQERGPLTGRVVGEYEDVALHFVALNVSCVLRTSSPSRGDALGHEPAERCGPGGPAVRREAAFPAPSGRARGYPYGTDGEGRQQSEDAPHLGGQVRGDEEHRHPDPQEAAMADVEIGGVPLSATGVC